MTESGVHPALPCTAEVDRAGVLTLGGCSVTALAARFGTPLYVYDVTHVRRSMRQARLAMGPAGDVHLAGKAYIAAWLAALAREEGLGLDVCSGTELEMALRWGFPAPALRLHGNNKPAAVLRRAVQIGVGAVVVDSPAELETLAGIAADCGKRATVLLRLNPGIHAHTHRYLQTGTDDSKFGLAIDAGDALAAVRRALQAPDSLYLAGYHAHIGTQILDLEPYRLLLRRMLAFAADVRDATGFWPERLSPGGGLGICYTDERPPLLADWLAALRSQLHEQPPGVRPLLGLEPGRAVVGPAGVAIYTVGVIKRAGSQRTYVAVDGGMADNIRPALYQARYAALAATRLHSPAVMTASVAGPYCETGDILVHEAALPELAPGDLLALPAAGAYCLPLSSNYNGALRPAVVTVEHGQARLVQRRQTLEDLLALDQ